MGGVYKCDVQGPLLLVKKKGETISRPTHSPFSISAV
jgi:hypothetical protein